MSDVLLNRRRDMMQVESVRCPYIDDGLSFWLDGIEKGTNISNNIWTDLIGGIKFDVSGLTVDDDNIYLNRVLNGDSEYLESVYTYEFVFKNTSQISLYDGFHLICSSRAAIMGMYNYLYFRYLAPQRNATFIQPVQAHIFSASDRVVLHNYSNVTNRGSSNVTPSSSIGYMQINGRDTTKLTNMYLYCVRLYNRSLTVEELLHNQQIDNERFNLGL